MRTIIATLPMYLSATMESSKNEKAGEAQKKTFTGHISGLATTHELINMPWPDIGQLLNNLEKGHTRRMIDLNGVVPKKRHHDEYTDI